MKQQTMIGESFGRLTVVSLAEGAVHGKKRKWLCKCECGNFTIVNTQKLRSGHTRSCGCLSRRPENTAQIERHGKSKTHLYGVWQAMKDRCWNPNNPSYARYGGRGISFCDEWQSFTQFEQWALANGYERGLEIDRINNDGDYTPDNCRWVKHRINLCNTHRKRTIIVGGEEKPLAQVAYENGFSYNDVYSQMMRGKTGDEIISTLRHWMKYAEA